MKPADQGRHYMTVFWMIVVTRAVEVCRHHGNEITPVLAEICLTQLNAGYFRNCVPLIGRLKLACQQLVLADGLFGIFRIYAGRSYKQQFLDPDQMACSDEIEPDGKIVSEKIGGIVIIRHYAANASSCHNDHVRAYFSKPAFRGLLLLKVELTMLGRQNRTALTQPAHDR